MSRSLRRILSPALLCALALPALARAEFVTPRPSPSASVKQTIGVTEFSLAYSRPGVKGRKIWGELVPYNERWRTGANETTLLTVSTDVTVGGKNLPAGTYGLVTIPTPDSWTVVFSQQKDLYGQTSSPYDSTKDALRLTIKPEAVEASQEWMWLGFDDLTPTSGNLVLRWEKLRLAVPITVEVTERVLANARAEIAAAKPDDWSIRHRAASWAFDNNVALAEAAGWLDASIAIDARYSNQNLKARWLAKDGKHAEAIAMAQKAIVWGKAQKTPPDMTAFEKQVAEWTAAMPAAKGKKSKKS